MVKPVTKGAFTPIHPFVEPKTDTSGVFLFFFFIIQKRKGWKRVRFVTFLNVFHSFVRIKRKWVEMKNLTHVWVYLTMIQVWFLSPPPALCGHKNRIFSNQTWATVIHSSRLEAYPVSDHVVWVKPRHGINSTSSQRSYTDRCQYVSGTTMQDSESDSRDCVQWTDRKLDL